MNAATWALIDGRQRDWVHAAIAYYRARVMIYRLMVREWEDELAQLTAAQVSEIDTKADFPKERQ